MRQETVRASAAVLDRVIKSDLCAGCGLCSSLTNGSIKMVMSPAGFLRPEQTEALSVETCQLISEICPGLGLVQSSHEANDHLLWGPVTAVRVGHSSDESLRHHASSGGALSAVLIHLLESGTVDRVVQISGSDSEAIGNMIVVSSSRDDVFLAAGSRYAPSAPLQTLHSELARPGRFALVGKPCDIAAVRALGQREPRVSEKIPALLSFFCAGVPSREGAREILKRLDVEESDVVAFRYRGDGWPGRVVATLRDGTEASMSYVDSWGGILTEHLQFRCKICPDGSGGFADITFGDAWYEAADGYPSFQEAEGRSLIITRTAVGENLLKSAADAGYLVSEPLAIGEIERMQPAQAARKKIVLARLAAMASTGRRPPRFRGMHLFRAAMAGGLLANARNFLGMVRRIVLRRGPRLGDPSSSIDPK